MITRDQISELFEHTRQLRREGRVDWDIDGLCRWSYYFVDVSKQKLLLLGEHLHKLGYERVGLREPSHGDADQETIYLQADRVEIHSVDTLLARNAELYALARQFMVHDYDGMDNGSIDGA